MKIKESGTGHCQVKAVQNVRFSGRHGDLPLREPVGAHFKFLSLKIKNENCYSFYFYAII